MLRKILSGKLHRATVTGADVNYMGSITLDPELMRAANIQPLQEVEVWNVNNGERLTTYALPGKPGSGDVILNGAAARKAEKGDVVVIAGYGFMDIRDMERIRVPVVMVGKGNQIGKMMEYRYTPGMQDFELVDA